jgi:hypothetical protein
MSLEQATTKIDAINWLDWEWDRPGIYVWGQSPQPGMEVHCHTVILLRMKTKCTVPQVQFLPTPQATTAVRNAGLKPVTHSGGGLQADGPTPQSVDKYVLAQSPPPFLVVNCLTNVHLYLSGRGEVP